MKSPKTLLLGGLEKSRVSVSEQLRQRKEANHLLERFADQPGVILADEVGMGKTFVALSVAYTVATRNARGPVVVMVPKNLIDKWCRDLDAFCELYLPERKVLDCRGGHHQGRTGPTPCHSIRHRLAQRRLSQAVGRPQAGALPHHFPGPRRHVPRAE